MACYLLLPMGAGARRGEGGREKRAPSAKVVGPGKFTFV